MPFILSTGTEKPGPTVRRSIRSHVMMGKNRGKTRSNKKSRPKARVTLPAEEEDHDLELSDQSDATSKSLSLSPVGPVVVPRKLVPDVTTFRLASSAEPHLVHGVLRCKSLRLACPAGGPGSTCYPCTSRGRRSRNYYYCVQ